MAMNKAEKALLDEFRARASLTLPPYSNPKPMTREEVIAAAPGPWDARYVVAWFMNAYNGSVTKGWTSSTSHNRDGEVPTPDERYHTASQTHGQPYRSELEALQAMRWEATREAMKKLGEIDARVEAEMARLP